MFNKKKKPEPTVQENLKAEIKVEDHKMANYIATKKVINKFISKYKSSLTNYARIYDYTLRFTLKKEYSDIYPNGFFAYADKLGLNIEPICNSSYSNTTRDFIVRAKKK